MTNENWALLSLIGFWLWLSTAIGFFLYGFPSKDFFKKKAAILWGSGVITSYGLWIIGMIKA